jgi:hypothetical protein
MKATPFLRQADVMRRREGKLAKGLFAKNVLAVGRSQQTNFFPYRGWRSNVDRIDSVRRQHLRPGTERARNAMLVCELLCSFDLAAGDGCQFSACGQLYHRRHGVRDPTGADDSPTEWRRLCGKYGRDRGYNCAGADCLQELATSSIDCRRIVVLVVWTIHTTLRQLTRFCSRYGLA